MDALLGHEHRPHEDVDLVVRLDDVPRIAEAIGGTFVEDYLPTRAALRCGEIQVDLHPVIFDADGTGWQVGAAPDGGDCPYPRAGFGTGAIAGVTVPCLTPDVQLAHHLGYPPRAQDREDMSLLSEAFHLRLSEPYHD